MRSSAPSAEPAWIVAMPPGWPVPHTLMRSSASGPRTSPTTTRSGLRRMEERTSSVMDTTPARVRNGTATDLDGTGTAAQCAGPVGIVLDSSDTIYVGDTFNHTLRRLLGTGTTASAQFAGLRPGAGYQLADAQEAPFPELSPVAAVSSLSLNHPGELP